MRPSIIIYRGRLPTNPSPIRIPLMEENRGRILTSLVIMNLGSLAIVAL